MLVKNKKVIYPEITIQRKVPVTFVDGENAAFLKKVDLRLRNVSLFNYTNVNVTPEGIVFTNFKIDEDLLIYPKHKKIYNKLYLLSSLIKRKKITLPANENYLLCFDYWSNGIFHWMCDVLPRIEAIKHITKNLVLLLPKDFKFEYIHETLKAFIFKDIYYVSDSTYLNCKNLISPQQITTSGQIRPDNILNLRQTLLDYFIPKFTGKFNYCNIYISRNKAKYRKVINEAELHPVLNKFGFKIIYFEDHSVSEQIEICYNANTIVSIHGANLTNIIFMQPGKNVLEFRKKDDLDNNYFYELADSVNCNYYFINCNYEDKTPGNNTFSLYVDANTLETTLSHLSSFV